MQEQAKQIDSQEAFYEVLHNLFQRARQHPPKGNLVHIGDCYKELALAAAMYIHRSLGATTVFREEAIKLATEFKGMTSIIHKTGGTFLKVQKNNLILQMYIAP